ncbi:ABC transporter permease [soil metagenome]
MSSNRSRVSAGVSSVLRAIIPVILAIVVGGIIILAMGRDPFVFYSKIFQYGLTGTNWMRSLVLMAPLLIIAVGLIIAFRGQLWNLGYGGQFLLGAVVVSGFGPALFNAVPSAVATPVLLVGSAIVGALWTVIPAFLKARYGTNEIITSLVMSFIGVGVVNLLIKGPLKDHSQPIPQTNVLDSGDMLPYIFGTKVHVGFLLAILIALAFAFVLSRTAFGLRMDVFGASPQSANHVGINATGMVFLVFALSGALIGLAGGVDVLGHESYQRANWDPHYGDAVMPFVFLARLNPIAVIPLIAFYAILATGGILAAQQAGLNSDFLLVIVGLILVFMTITEFVTSRRALGQGYLPTGLKRSVTSLFDSILRKGDR